MRSAFVTILFAHLAAAVIPVTCIAADAPTATVNARDLLQAFKRDRTDAHNKYRDKIITVTGILDSVGRVTGGEALTLEIAAVCRVRRKNPELERIKVALKAEDDRMEEARKWAREFDRDRRKRVLRQNDDDWRRRDSDAYREYSDSRNPHGPRDENLIVDVSITGLCRGIRSGKVYIDNCEDLSFTTRAGNRLEILQEKK